jgi:hypothetical protein
MGGGLGSRGDLEGDAAMLVSWRGCSHVSEDLAIALGTVYGVRMSGVCLCSSLEMFECRCHRGRRLGCAVHGRSLDQGQGQGSTCEAEDEDGQARAI